MLREHLFATKRSYGNVLQNVILFSRTNIVAEATAKGLPFCFFISVLIGNFNVLSMLVSLTGRLGMNLSKLILNHWYYAFDGNSNMCFVLSELNHTS